MDLSPRLVIDEDVQVDDDSPSSGDAIFVVEPKYRAAGRPLLTSMTTQADGADQLDYAPASPVTSHHDRDDLNEARLDITTDSEVISVTSTKAARNPLLASLLAKHATARQETDPVMITATSRSPIAEYRLENGKLIRRAAVSPVTTVTPRVSAASTITSSSSHGAHKSTPVAHLQQLVEGVSTQSPLEVSKDEPSKLQLGEVRTRLRRMKQRGKETLKVYARRLIEFTRHKYADHRTEQEDLVDQFTCGVRDVYIARMIAAVTPKITTIWQALEIALLTEHNVAKRFEQYSAPRHPSWMSPGAVTDRCAAPYPPNTSHAGRSSTKNSHAKQREEELKTALLKLWQCFKDVQAADYKVNQRDASTQRPEFMVFQPVSSTAAQFPSSTRSGQTPSPTKTPRQRDLRLKICLYCKNTGHYVRDCEQYKGDQEFERRRAAEKGQ